MSWQCSQVFFRLRAHRVRCASRRLRLLKSQCNFMYSVLGVCHSSLVSKSQSTFTVFRECKVIRIFCGTIIMHAVSLFWTDRMIGKGWEEGVIQCVAPAGWTWCPPESFDIEKSCQSPSPLPCPLRSLSLVRTMADTYLICWLHVWTFREQSFFGDSQWRVFDRMILYLFLLILAMIVWYFAWPLTAILCCLFFWLHACLFRWFRRMTDDK